MSVDGGHYPTWSRDSRVLFYRFRDTVKAVDVAWEEEGKISAGLPRTLFSTELLATYQQGFDVALDGSHFLGIEPQPGSEPTRIEVVLNWFQDLQTKVPAGAGS